jgi:hypothetical protein
MVGEQGQRWASWRLTQAQTHRGGVRQKSCIHYPGQFNHPGAVRVAFEHLRRHTLRQARLAYATGADQRQQSGGAQQMLDFNQLLIASDETVELNRQVVQRARGRRKQGVQLMPIACSTAPSSS